MVAILLWSDTWMQFVCDWSHGHMTSCNPLIRNHDCTTSRIFLVVMMGGVSWGSSPPSSSSPSCCVIDVFLPDDVTYLLLLLKRADRNHVSCRWRTQQQLSVFLWDSSVSMWPQAWITQSQSLRAEDDHVMLQMSTQKTWSPPDDWTTTEAQYLSASQVYSQCPFRCWGRRLWDRHVVPRETRVHRRDIAGWTGSKDTDLRNHRTPSRSTFWLLEELSPVVEQYGRLLTGGVALYGNIDADY